MIFLNKSKHPHELIISNHPQDTIPSTKTGTNSSKYLGSIAKELLGLR